MNWLINAFIAALKTPHAVTDTPASAETDLRKSPAAIAQPQNALPWLNGDMRRRSLSQEALIRARASQERRNRKQAAAYIEKNTSLIQHKEH